MQTYEKILSNGTTLVLPANSELLNYLQSPGSDYNQENELPAVQESTTGNGVSAAEPGAAQDSREG